MQYPSYSEVIVVSAVQVISSAYEGQLLVTLSITVPFR